MSAAETVPGVIPRWTAITLIVTSRSLFVRAEYFTRARSKHDGQGSAQLWQEQQVFQAG
jgi:hypothetical protein